VRDSAAQTYSVTAVPLVEREIEPFSVPGPETALRPDPRFVGKINWYVKPIVFGGDPAVGPNLTWVNAEQHAQLVRWWNDTYRSVKNQKSVLVNGLTGDSFPQGSDSAQLQPRRSEAIRSPRM
jgi:hypothetical protein